MCDVSNSFWCQKFYKDFKNKFSTWKYFNWFFFSTESLCLSLDFVLSDLSCILLSADSIVSVLLNCQKLVIFIYTNFTMFNESSRNWILYFYCSFLHKFLVKVSIIDEFRQRKYWTQFFLTGSTSRTCFTVWYKQSVSLSPTS